MKSNLALIIHKIEEKSLSDLGNRHEKWINEINQFFSVFLA
jgi:hypothetical protein